MAFTINERRKLLDEYFKILQIISDEAAGSIGSAPSVVSDSHISRLLDVVHLYEAGLPRIPISRCPLTGELVMHTFDPYGLDGLWWNYEAPVRPLIERFVTCLVATGAVHLAPEVECFPFLCKPGPGVPYVYPKLLSIDGIYGVVHKRPVGQHMAYSILYYSAEPITGVEMPNSWGTNTYWDDSDGKPGWYTSPDNPEEWDFNLRPWVQSGKLLWIAPEDAQMQLRSDLNECPYFDIRGERQLQRIARGMVWLDTQDLKLVEGP
ncbi:MAG: hypothetical protein EPN25_00335 [Nitrospirae bacterium]|nr:MAG: hypothetical protein EPN25_00335 [Nitrospirota bacterium]